MMKLIDKLLRKLGYVRIKDGQRIVNNYKEFHSHNRDIVLFADVENECYVVGRHISGTQISFIIKKFPFGDDPDYALLCTQELVEELEKEI